MRRDFASKKSLNYKAPRKHVRRDKLKVEIVKKRIKAIFLSLLMIGFVVSFLYWILYSPLFRIYNIEITGEKGQNHAELSSIVYNKLGSSKWLVIPKNNYFIFSAEQLERQLNKKGDELNPQINNIVAAKVWPDKLLITFTERVPRLRVFVLQDRIITEEDSEEKKDILTVSAEYFIDDKGLVIEQAVSDDGNEPIVEYITDSMIKKGDLLFDSEIMNAVLTLFSSLDKFSWFSVSRMRIKDNALHDLLVYTDKEYYFYFNVKYSLQKQINNLVLTLDKVQEAGQISRLKYVDLRIKNRAYACCNLDEVE